MTPIESLLRKAKWKCGCCGGPAHMNEITGKMHGDECRCFRCAFVRHAEIHRVCIGTGTRHLVRRDEQKTLCGRRLPDTTKHGVFLRPRDEDCKACVRVYNLIP